MDHLPGFREDDENNTLTFERWEEHVVKHYPNPERIGCPGHEVLQRFVDAPGQVGLDELNDTHITRCRECTLELRNLREQREQGLAAARPPFVGSHLSRWSSLIAAIAACLVIAVGIAYWKAGSSKPGAIDEAVVNVEVDLSGDGVTRGDGSQLSEVQVSLPRRLVSLHLKLPFYSPQGRYRITVQNDRSTTLLRDVAVNAAANGPNTDLRVTLDLRYLPPGKYVLGTTHDGEISYYYPLSLN